MLKNKEEGEVRHISVDQFPFHRDLQHSLTFAFPTSYLVYGVSAFQETAIPSYNTLTYVRVLVAGEGPSPFLVIKKIGHVWSAVMIEHRLRTGWGV